MNFYSDFKNKIFSDSEINFNSLALELFKFQAKSNEVYARFIGLLGIEAEEVARVEDIPFMPIDFFRKHKILSHGLREEVVFESSGTTSDNASKHYIHDLSLYRESLLRTFKYFYKNQDDYLILALTPSPQQNSKSSLVFMLSELIKQSRKDDSGFYLDDFKSLADILHNSTEKKILIGLSYALMDFAESFPMSLNGTIVMETGGMKGKREELPRQALHAYLCEQFALGNIHSEYGMTELLSQAYSKGDGIFHTPPLMKVLIRDQTDPLSIVQDSGCINIIDLVNIGSCAFIATDDLGKLHTDGSFEVSGRTDMSEQRGCNLLI